MRKHITLVAAATTVLLTAACGSGSGGSSGTSSGKPELVFIQGVAGDTFYVTMQCGAEAEAKKQGATVKTQGPQKFDSSLQTPIVQSVVASKPDAILIAPTDVAALQQPLEQAKRAGIKVVLVDTTLKDPSVAVSSVSSDNVAGGTTAFEALKQSIPDGGKVLVMSQQPGVSTTDEREKGFAEAVKKDPKYQYLGVQYAQNDPQKAAQIISAALQKDPDIAGVFAVDLDSAQGTVTGVKQSNKAGKVKIVGFDAGPDQVDALADGTVQALVAQQPYDMGVQGVQQAINAIDGKSTTKKIGTKFTILTKDNLESSEGKAAVYQSSC